MEYIREISAFILGILVASIFLTAPVPELQQPSFEGSRSAETYIAAVSSSGQGVLGSVNVRITPGDGSLLLNANPFIRLIHRYQLKQPRK
jgi:predicted S18 family serine protease